GNSLRAAVARMNENFISGYQTWKDCFSYFAVEEIHVETQPLQAGALEGAGRRGHVLDGEAGRVEDRAPLAARDEACDHLAQGPGEVGLDIDPVTDRHVHLAAVEGLLGIVHVDRRAEEDVEGELALAGGVRAHGVDVRMREERVGLDDGRPRGRE